MPFPSFYDRDKVGTLYHPDTTLAVTAGHQHELKPSEADKLRVLLLLVDIQVDFVHIDGSLSVPGAIDDTRRLIEWLFTHASQITTIAASLDSHVPIQIFSPTWWVDDQGQHPDPFTLITHNQLRAGRWRALYESDWSQIYVAQLEQAAKKQLMIWPYHTLIGTPGHNLVPSLFEAIAYHSAARQSQPMFLTKGSLPKTEHYSVLEPEVKIPEIEEGDLNTDFLDHMTSYDLIYITGQAKSHCVLETVSSIMRYFKGSSEMISKLRILMDCTSSVAHPEIDFDQLADQAFADFQEQGLTLVTTEYPLA